MQLAESRSNMIARSKVEDYACCCMEDTLQCTVRVRCFIHWLIYRCIALHVCIDASEFEPMYGIKQQTPLVNHTTWHLFYLHVRGVSSMGVWVCRLWVCGCVVCVGVSSMGVWVCRLWVCPCWQFSWFIVIFNNVGLKLLKFNTYLFVVHRHIVRLLFQ